jgi:hypothetical protein
MKSQCARSRDHRTTRQFGRLLLLTFLFTLRAVAQVSNSQKQVSNATTSSFELPSPAEVDRAIILAANYLERTCGPDGRFAYRINIDTGRQSHSYNIVRHAGAIYALAMAQRFKPDQQNSHRVSWQRHDQRGARC